MKIFKTILDLQLWFDKVNFIEGYYKHRIMNINFYFIYPFNCGILLPVIGYLGLNSTVYGNSERFFILTQTKICER